MEDYLSQLRQMKKMGGMEGVLSMLPGVSKIKKQMDNANIDESIIKINEAIISATMVIFFTISKLG